MKYCPALRPLLQPARRRARKRQVDLAIAHGVSIAYLSQLEAGYLANRPHIQTIVEFTKSVDADVRAVVAAVADALGRTVEDVAAELPPDLRLEVFEEKVSA